MSINLETIRGCAVTGAIVGTACVVAAGPVLGVSLGIYGAVTLIGFGAGLGGYFAVTKKGDDAVVTIAALERKLEIVTLDTARKTAEVALRWNTLLGCSVWSLLTGGLAMGCRWIANQLNCEAAQPAPVECTFFRPMTLALMAASVASAVFAGFKFFGYQDACTAENASIAEEWMVKKALAQARP